MEEIRALCKSLLPPALSHTSLIDALDDFIQNIKQVDQVQIITEWENIDESQMCDKMKLTIFRIVQEQFNNIFKHARAKTIIVRLVQQNDGLQLNIKDDGIGFNTSQKRNGVGLQNIISRASLLKGEVMVNSRIGAGCELSVAFQMRVANMQQRLAS